MKLGEVCSHMAAVLFKVEANTRLGYNQVSCTSVPFIWNQTYTKKICVHHLGWERHQRLKTCTPDGIFKELKRIVEELKMCGVERVFVSSIMERGKIHPRANISVKDFNKVRKSVNEKLRSDYVDTAKRLIYPRHYGSDLIHPGVREGGMLMLRHAVMSAFAKTIPKSVVFRK